MEIPNKINYVDVNFDQYNTDDCIVSYGTSKFIISACLTLNLSLNITITSLRFLNSIYSHVSPSAVYIKFLACSCILVAWKLWEDIEGNCSHMKVIELANAYYIVYTCANKDVIETNIELVNWINADKGIEQRKIATTITKFEKIVLMIFKYNTIMQECTMLLPTVAKSIGDLIPNALENPLLFDQIYSFSVGIILDYLHWPRSKNFSLEEIAIAAIIKATVSLAIKLADSPDKLTDIQLSLLNNKLPAILNDIRNTYDLIPEVYRVLGI